MVAMVVVFMVGASAGEGGGCGDADGGSHDGGYKKKNAYGRH